MVDKRFGPKAEAPKSEWGNLIWKLRQRTGWTLREIALLMNVSQRTVSAWSHGKEQPAQRRIDFWTPRLTGYVLEHTGENRVHRRKPPAVPKFFREGSPAEARPLAAKASHAGLFFAVEDNLHDHQERAKDGAKQTQLDQATSLLLSTVIDGLRHGHFECSGSCEMVSGGKRRVVIRSGKQHQFLISEKELPR